MNELSNNFEIDFINVCKEKKHFWEWKIEIKNRNNNIKKGDNIITINPEEELLLDSHIYNDSIKKGHICCDIIFKNVDIKECYFYNNFNNIINFIFNNFCEKFEKGLNMKVLNFINPINDNKIKSYLAKNSKNIFTKFVNIDNLKTDYLTEDELPINIYIYPKLTFRSIRIFKKNVYIDIILKECFIYKKHKYKFKKTFYQHNNITNLPIEIILKILKTIINICMNLGLFHLLKLIVLSGNIRKLNLY